MARFSLSFISIFLVLAVLTLSMPTARDGQAPSQSLRLDSADHGLTHPTRSTDRLSNEKEEQEAKIAAKLAEKAGSAAKSTPAATPTDESKPKFTGLGRVPFLGPVIGDIGGGI
ncbi:hypothetical protein N7517_005504 [Penicillium concentricum]|uniref:Uncharacterized protein n=1 Tax=Penicillium concentricum TaxID=293559 RepID=A0A9W9SC91_9EURO|nr:uncharacterized protein N7517_005504 [Penicillium concentricum]KAJ5373498.1 hypothetical protein N7517_005504 [Penicillium concentricum]